MASNIIAIEQYALDGTGNGMLKVLEELMPVLVMFMDGGSDDDVFGGDGAEDVGVGAGGFGAEDGEVY